MDYLLKLYKKDHPKSKNADFKFLGSGIGRSSYLVSNYCNYVPFVAKIARNNNGKSQNEAEIMTYEDCPSELIPKIYDWDQYKRPNWVEMEYLTPITRKRFKEITGVSQTFFSSTRYYCNKYKERIPFIKKILELEDVGIDLYEMARMDHWGLDSNGKLKLIDLG